MLALVAVSYPLVEAAHAHALAARALSARGGLTRSQLARDVRNATHVTNVPANLKPSLARARLPVSVGCGVGRAAVRASPCLWGDPRSPRSVVVFGDSHAAMWFTAVASIGTTQHWRVVDLTKSGCPPVEVNIAAWFLGGATYSACSRWRATAMREIAAIHPSLVIVSWARWLEELEARPMRGVPRRYGSAWANGVAAMFSFLRRVSRRVVFISDIPTLGSPAPSCLSRHMSDAQACTPSRSAAILLPAVKTEELTLATQNRVSSIDPTPWFCTAAVCPVIVHNILVYHDTSHITKEWARFIAPVLADVILPLVGHA